MPEADSKSTTSKSKQNRGQGKRREKTLDVAVTGGRRWAAKGLQGKRRALKRVQQAALEAETGVIPKAPAPEKLKAFQRAQKRSRELTKQQQRAQRRSTARFLAKPSRKGKRYELDLRIHSPASSGYFSTGGV
ncbi:MAG: hypothetical protein KDD44_08435, partial [Bdellovibrionales bacterium]|nr:hypothetical protein [Bdellovibrionales bacterium]